jgi:hypothetical protein
VEDVSCVEEEQQHHEALITVAATARPMGNVCVGNPFSKNRFFGHFSL